MSNEQKAWEIVEDEFDFHGLTLDGGPLCRKLGIDPDMSVSELQRRLRIAERVLSWDFVRWAQGEHYHAWSEGQGSDPPDEWSDIIGLTPRLPSEDDQ